MSDYPREYGFRLPQVIKTPLWLYNIYDYREKKSPKSMQLSDTSGKWHIAERGRLLEVSHAILTASRAYGR